jgi:CRP-like cAMP-binding protein
VSKVSSDPPVKNQLLAALPQKELKRILPNLEPVALQTKEVLFEAFQPIQYVYFPESGLITKFIATEDGDGAEIGMTGKEGMAGICCYLRSDTSPFKAVVQIPGEARRIKAAVFQAAVKGNEVWTDLLLKYIHAFLSMVSQSAGCNLLHDVEKRFCKSLLMAHDRMDSDEFSLTQESLALMLGVRRQSISEVANKLSRKKLIRYRWGQLTILDRQGLEAVACGCYRLIKQNFRFASSPGG